MSDGLRAGGQAQGCGCGLALGWYNVGKRAGDYGSNGGTTDKRGGMCRKRKRKSGYTITEILVA